MSWVIGGLLVWAVLDVTFRVWAASKMLRFFEDQPPFNVRPTQSDTDGEEVWFPTTDGLTLRGTLYRHETRPARGLILFCPEMSGSRWSAMNYCAALWDAGFDILTFDFRNQGESDRQPGYQPMHWLTEYEVSDALAAIAFSRTRDGLRELPLGLFGISRGGGTALAAAARRPEVQCVACEGAFTAESMQLHYTLRWYVLYAPAWVMKFIPRWHLKQTLALVRWVSQLRHGCRYTHLERLLPRLKGRPVLMITGERDTYVGPAITETMHRSIGGDQAQLWVVPRAKHNLARDVAPADYDRRLVEFFSTLTVPAPTGVVN